MAARQNLRKRTRRAAERGTYDPYRASYGPEYERLAIRAGHPPFRTCTREEMIRKGNSLNSNAIYGRYGHSHVDDRTIERPEIAWHGSVITEEGIVHFMDAVSAYPADSEGGRHE